jgi:hypothetical protein
MTVMSNLYHISFIFHGVPKVRDLEPAFADQEDDWIRPSPFLWLLWSPKPIVQIYNRLKPLLDANDQFFISKVDMTHSLGFLNPWVWDWMNKKMPGSIFVGDQLVKRLEQLEPPRT